ncbi:unnamed protein product, partial [Meganyctiphanes norvegica]
RSIAGLKSSPCRPGSKRDRQGRCRKMFVPRGQPQRPRQNTSGGGRCKPTERRIGPNCILQVNNKGLARTHQVVEDQTSSLGIHQVVEYQTSGLRTHQVVEDQTNSLGIHQVVKDQTRTGGLRIQNANLMKYRLEPIASLEVEGAPQPI